jgi:hypothetical protein
MLQKVPPICREVPESVPDTAAASVVVLIRADGSGALRVYPTFEADSAETGDRIALKAQDAGGRIVKPPYDTRYNGCQCVIEHPEGDLFRINHRKGPRHPAAEVENPPWNASS